MKLSKVVLIIKTLIIATVLILGSAFVFSKLFYKTIIVQASNKSKSSVNINKSQHEESLKFTSKNFANTHSSINFSTTKSPNSNPQLPNELSNNITSSNTTSNKTAFNNITSNNASNKTTSKNNSSTNQENSQKIKPINTHAQINSPATIAPNTNSKIGNESPNSNPQLPNELSNNITSSNVTHNSIQVQKCTITPQISTTPQPTKLLYHETNNSEKIITQKTSDTNKVLSTTPLAPTTRQSNTVYLTMDDGSGRNYIIKALNDFKKYNIKATFFIVGEFLKINKDLWNRAILEGHEICNHTYSHADLSKLSDEQIKKEILEWEKAAVESLGQNYLNKMKSSTPFFRFPYGSGSNNTRLLKLISSLGYKSFYWNIETFSTVIFKFPQLSPDERAKKVSFFISNNVKVDDIILLHFNNEDTKYLDQTLANLINRGMHFEKLSAKK